MVPFTPEERYTKTTLRAAAGQNYFNVSSCILTDRNSILTDRNGTQGRRRPELL
jgi:hypothetical protein